MPLYFTIFIKIVQKIINKYNCFNKKKGRIRRAASFYFLDHYNIYIRYSSIVLTINFCHGNLIDHHFY